MSVKETLTVEFTSDEWVPRKGFKAIYTVSDREYRFFNYFRIM